MMQAVQEPTVAEADPFAVPAFRADLALLVAATRDASRRFADDAVLLTRLAAQVPREPGDERGGTAWTSFVREVAVARCSSDRAAAADLALAGRLVAHMPRALALLRSGDLPVLRARALVEATYGCSDRTLERIDAEVTERACRLTPSRIRDAVERVLLQEEADAVAARAAAATAVRNVRRAALRDDQAEIALQGPAVPLAQAYATLDADARALRAQGDGRGLDALRFDLATSRLLGGHVADVGLPRAHESGSTDDPTPTADQARTPGSHRDGPSTPQQPALPPAPRSSEPTATAPSTYEPTATAPSTCAPSTCACTACAPSTCACTACGCAGSPAPLSSPPDAGSAAWLTDRRWSRPVRVDITVPVTTALGLSNEPGWLDGHGWISAPACRQLLVLAELRQVCVDAGSGRLVDLADRVVRPALDPAAVSAALRDMATDPFDITETAWQPEPQHDPGEALREFVVLRDRLRDGPTGRRADGPTGRRADGRQGQLPAGPPRPRRRAP